MKKIGRYISKTEKGAASGVAELNASGKVPASQIDSTAMTNAEVKAAYEANAETNAYTDSEKTKVGHLSVTQAVNLDQLETDVASNSSKTGITSGQAQAITANTAKTGITSGQASAITANTAKTGITSGQASAITANTAKTGITSGQASAITANTAKTGITSGQASAITANTAKTGITSGQADAIIANTAKTRPEITKSLFIDTPIAADDIGIWQPGVAITVTKVVVQGIGATSTTFNINSNGTDLWTSDKVATTTKQSITSFNNAGFAADQYVQYQASAISGTPTGIKITITYTEG